MSPQISRSTGVSIATAIKELTCCVNVTCFKVDLPPSTMHSHSNMAWWLHSNAHKIKNCWVLMAGDQSSTDGW